MHSRKVYLGDLVVCYEVLALRERPPAQSTLSANWLLWTRLTLLSFTQIVA